MKEHTLAIIGGGAAAFAAATKANDLHAETLIINSGLPIGGTCLNVGCVPSKHLLEVGAQFFYGQRPTFKAIRAHEHLQFDFKQAVLSKNDLVGELRKSNYVDVIDRFKTVRYIDGRARFVNEHEIEVNGERMRASRFIIATGSRAMRPAIPGIENVKYLTNVEALNLDHLPASMTVIGGGPLGLEFAQMFLHFGTKVTVLEKAKRILPLEEPEISAALHRALEEEGMVIHTNVEIRRARVDGVHKIVEFLERGEELEISAEELLLATGIEPNTRDLGLEHAGVAVDSKGFVVTNTEMLTTRDHIWAAGDCVGKLALETVAAREGAVAAENAINGSHKHVNYDVIPHAVFTTPQVASVGLTERELMKRINVCSCRTVSLAKVPKAKAVGEKHGVIKLVVDPRTGTIVGCHIVSPHAAEMIHEAVLAVRHNLSIDDIIDTVHVFPTFSEGIKLAALAFTRDINVMTCCIG